VLYAVAFMTTLYSVRVYTLARERLRTDRKLERLALEHLQELDKVKTNFFTNVSHELRTPLTLILGPAEQLATEPSDAVVRQQGSLVLRHARKLLHLINQLLDLSKLEAGALRLVPAAGDLVAFVRPLLESFASLAQAQQVKLSLQATAQKLPAVFDPGKLEEIITNLLSNALKFTPAGGEVTLELQERPATATEPAGAVELIVRDTGIGIEPQHLPHLFDRFYQASHPEAASMRAGTGIGLALVKELTELHGGSVSVESQPGAGTAFSIRLPRQPRLVALAPAPEPALDRTPVPVTNVALAAPADEIRHEAPAPDAAVVLVIEDNAEVRQFILNALRPASYHLLEAAAGEVGVTLARDQVPDLIISDVMMPGMDGYEVCRQLKTDAATSHIPIVLLTAKSTPEDKLTGLEIGADSYLTKPFNPRELRAQVRNLLDLRQRLQALYAGIEALTPIPDAHAAAVAGLPSLDQSFLNRMREAVEQHLDDGEFSVETLSEELGMSRTQVHRKLKALTGQSASEFIRGTRLHRAHALLQAQVATVSEVAYQVGFNSPAHFSTSFSKQFGYAPSEVARK
jgi:DNA-binding response OmpR family regulator/nitrogen-specific signal transduction histidine kinase